MDRFRQECLRPKYKFACSSIDAAVSPPSFCAVPALSRDRMMDPSSLCVCVCVPDQYGSKASLLYIHVGSSMGVCIVINGEKGLCGVVCGGLFCGGMATVVVVAEDAYLHSFADVCVPIAKGDPSNVLPCYTRSTLFWTHEERAAAATSIETYAN